MLEEQCEQTETRSCRSQFGTDLFPEPLTKEKETYFLNLIRTEQREEARRILIRHNLRLVSYIAEKYRSSKVELGDLISIGTIGLIQAVNSFDPDKQVKLGTYAARCIENEIIMFLRWKKRKCTDISIEEVKSCDEAGNVRHIYDIISTGENPVEEKIQKEAEKMELQNALRALPEKDRKLIMLRYGIDRADGKERTQSEVAGMMGISQSYLSRAERKILSRMKEQIMKIYA